MQKAILVFGVLLALFAAGCATLGGGQTDPFLSKLVPATLSDYGPTLAGQCTESCNVGACKEYNLNMTICGNPTQFVAALPPIPLSTITPATEAQAITAVCNTNGYLPSAAQTAVAGNCIYTPPTSAVSPPVNLKLNNLK